MSAAVGVGVTPDQLEGVSKIGIPTPRTIITLPIIGTNFTPMNANTTRPRKKSRHGRAAPEPHL